MGKSFVRSFRKNIFLGRLGMPVWTVALALMLVAAAAGQAVGPVLSGSVQGKVNLTVAQTVLLDAEDDDVIVVSDADDAVATVNDEGTQFTVAIVTQVGQNQTITLDLVNKSGARANAVLELMVPQGIDVDADEGNAMVAMARMSNNAFLFTLEADDPDSDNDDIVITIETKDDLAPGYYSIVGRILQIAQ